MRLPNGYGTVYKMQGKRRKPWIARAFEGWEMVPDKKTGEEIERPIYTTVGYYESKKEGIEALALYRANSGIVPTKADITLGELYEEWSKAKYERVSKQAADCSRAAWKHMSKHKKVVFRELRTAHIQGVVDSCHRAGMSQSSLQKIKSLGTMLYKYALQNDIINKNYAEFVVLPRIERQEKKIFSHLEIQKMEKNAGVPWVDTILILIYSGLRINEMLGLTRFSIDWDKQTITGGLKTEAGKNRVIPIHPKIIRHIKKWHDSGGDYLIHRDGKRISDNYYRENYYYPTLDALDIRKLTPHSCRHTFASRLREEGVDPKIIQLLMGHTKYAFTADTYTHVDVQELASEITKI